MATPRLDPVPWRVAPARRLPHLIAGLALYGFSIAVQIEVGLGLAPWDVLHEALHRLTGLSFGTVSAITSVGVMLCWIPLRQRPGVGTIANVVVVAASVDVTLWLLPTPEGLPVRITALVLAVAFNGVATAAYIGARLGPGPRDGLMTGTSHRTGFAVRWVRTAIEITVLAAGWVLGGTVGLGTALYALAIGPLTQLFLPALTWRPRAPADSRH